MSSDGKRWLMPAILLIAVFAIYRQVLEHNFTYFDDHAYVFRNPVVLSGLNWSSIEWAFSTGFGSNYHPLTWLSHMLDVQVFGLWAGGHAFTNLLWHCANVLLVWQLARRLFGRDSVGFLVAVLFAVHPLNVESVANISQRKSVISVCFGIISLLSYLRYAERGGKLSYLASIGAAALSLLAKPLLVTLPALLLLLDIWPLARLQGSIAKPSPGKSPIVPIRGGTATVSRLIIEKIPFILLAGSLAIATYYFQHDSGAMSAAKVSPLTSLTAAVSSYFFYLQKMFWPEGLAAFYPLPDAYSVTNLVVSTSGLMVISVTVWLVRKSRPYLCFGWLWFLGTLVPMAGFVRVGGMGMADRYAYFPLLGIFFALTILATEWWDSIPSNRRIYRTLLLACGVGFAVFLALVAHRQVGYWRTTARLFARIMTTQGPNDTLLNLMGYEAFDQGDFARAIPYFQKTLVVVPDNPEAIANLGISLFAVGRYEEADIWLERASKTRLAPSAGVLNARGTIAVQRGRDDDACRFWREAIMAAPNFGEARRNLARALCRKSAPDEALAIIDEGIQLTPRDYRMYEARSEILAALARADEARSAREEAERLRKENALVPAFQGPASAPTH